MAVGSSPVAKLGSPKECNQRLNWVNTSILNPLVRVIRKNIKSGEWIYTRSIMFYPCVYFKAMEGQKGVFFHPFKLLDFPCFGPANN